MKVSFGGVLKYMTVDSGCSEVLIDGDLAKELKRQGIIARGSYEGIERFILADGSEVWIEKFRCRRFRSAIAKKTSWSESSKKVACSWAWDFGAFSIRGPSIKFALKSGCRRGETWSFVNFFKQNCGPEIKGLDDQNRIIHSQATVKMKQWFITQELPH